MKYKVGPCQHCGRSDLTLKPRHLCHKCYDNKAIRKLYPSGMPTVDDDVENMTEDEVNALVNAQLRKKPKWWYAGEQIQEGKAGKHEPKVAAILERIILRNRGQVINHKARY